MPAPFFVGLELERWARDAGQPCARQTDARCHFWHTEQNFQELCEEYREHAFLLIAVLAQLCAFLFRPGSSRSIEVKLEVK